MLEMKLQGRAWAQTQAQAGAPDTHHLPPGMVFADGHRASIRSCPGVLRVCTGMCSFVCLAVHRFIPS